MQLLLELEAQAQECSTVTWLWVRVKPSNDNREDYRPFSYSLLPFPSKCVYPWMLMIILNNVVIIMDLPSCPEEINLHIWMSHTSYTFSDIKYRQCLRYCKQAKLQTGNASAAISSLRGCSYSVVNVKHFHHLCVDSQLLWCSYSMSQSVS